MSQRRSLWDTRGLCVCQVLYQDCHMVPVTTPYVAGFLAFREVPVLVEAVQRLQREKPQLQPQVGCFPCSWEGFSPSGVGAGGARSELCWSIRSLS